jgi:hypothetical protein
MLLICSGEDSYRAIRKAQELELAFKEKFDKSGMSADHLEGGKSMIEELLKKADTVSLFSPKRFIRCDGLIEQCPKNRLEAVIKSLNKDADNIIVVTVEAQTISEAALKPWKDVQKQFHYPFPRLDGSAWQQFVIDEANKRSVPSSDDLNKLIEQAQGDSWFVIKELEKKEANANYKFGAKQQNQDLFFQVDQFLQSGKRVPELSSALPLLLSQIRSIIRVQDNATVGLSSYVIQKWRRERTKNDQKQAFKKTIEALYLQRNSFSDEEESQNLI